MATPNRDSAAFLREIYARHARANPRYSLRAFARRIGLSPGGLSQVLNRKKRLSLDRAHAVARRLELGQRELDYFLLLVQWDAAETLERRAAIDESLRALGGEGESLHNLALENFRLISDWFGLAILEYVTGGRGGGAREIARYFGIEPNQAETALERLCRLELIERDDKGGYRRTAGRLLVESGVPDEAIRNYYLGVLERARASVPAQTPAEKVIGAEVFNLDPADLPAVRRLTDDYLGQLQALAARGRERSAVYQAFVDVFRLGPDSTETVRKA